MAKTTSFTTLIRALLTTPQDPRLRLIVRDDARAPHSFTFAATCPSEHVLAYRFSLPPALFIRELHTIADDPSTSPTSAPRPSCSSPARTSPIAATPTP